MGATGTNVLSPLQNRSVQHTHMTHIDQILNNVLAVGSSAHDQETSGYGNEEQWRRTANPPNNFSSNEQYTSDEMSQANAYDQM